jgi:hypothetical protein
MESRRRRSDGKEEDEKCRKGEGREVMERWNKRSDGKVEEEK